jgi:hypothetical protein
MMYRRPIVFSISTPFGTKENPRLRNMTKMLISGIIVGAGAYVVSGENFRSSFVNLAGNVSGSLNRTTLLGSKEARLIEPIQFALANFTALDIDPPDGLIQMPELTSILMAGYMGELELEDHTRVLLNELSLGLEEIGHIIGTQPIVVHDLEYKGPRVLRVENLYGMSQEDLEAYRGRRGPVINKDYVQMGLISAPQ